VPKGRPTRTPPRNPIQNPLLPRRPIPRLYCPGRFRPELFPGTGVLSGPATESHVVNRGTRSPTGTAEAECPGEEEPPACEAPAAQISQRAPQITGILVVRNSQSERLCRSQDRCPQDVSIILSLFMIIIIIILIYFFALPRKFSLFYFWKFSSR